MGKVAEKYSSRQVPAHLMCAHSFCRPRLFVIMDTQQRSTQFKQKMVTFSTFREYRQGEWRTRVTYTAVHKRRWCSSSMACSVLHRTGSPICPMKVLPSFWLTRDLMFGWATCEETPMAFVTSSTKRIQINFGISGICCSPGCCFNINLQNVNADLRWKTIGQY